MKINAHNYFKALCLTVLISYLPASTVGKIAGIVTDKSSGEALAGANVMIAGTNLGGSADENG